MFKRFLIASLFLAPFLASSYVSPGQPSGFVNDFAGILKVETTTALNQQLAQFSNDTGNEISVVTIVTYGLDETIETYAEKLFQEWGIGKEQEDNGLLLLIAHDDREMRIEVGYGLEPIITDIESGRVVREVLIPAFKNANYDEGIIQAVNIITGLIKEEDISYQSSSKITNWSDFLWIVIFVFIYLGSLLARSKSWWAGGIVGGILGAIFFSSIIAAIICILVGLGFDFLVSRAYKNSISRGGVPPWWIGGGGHSSGGFGGFGGGMSGGGGVSGRW